MSKRSLNLSIEEDTIERARAYSERHGTSLSRLVGEFLERLVRSVSDREEDELSPTVRRLIGIGAGETGEEDYRRHLLDRYGE